MLSPDVRIWMETRPGTEAVQWLDVFRSLETLRQSRGSYTESGELLGLFERLNMESELVMGATGGGFDS